MTTDTLLLIGRDSPDARDAFETHAERLRRRDLADEVRLLLYEGEPARALAADLAAVEGDAYAVPLRFAHDHETLRAVPRALSRADAEVAYCDPVGRDPAITDVVADRVAERAPLREDTAVVLVAFGSGSTPHQRRAAERQAERLREKTPVGDVTTAYLLQNPAVECARYNVSEDRAVAVPLFLADTEATADAIPAKLELDRGGLAYADAFGDHPRLTDAIHAEVAKRRIQVEERGGDAAEAGAAPIGSATPVATDGDGTGR